MCQKQTTAYQLQYYCLTFRLVTASPLTNFYRLRQANKWVLAFAYTSSCSCDNGIILDCAMLDKVTRAGPLLGAECAGPGVFEHSPLTRLLSHVATRSKRYSKERETT